MGKLVREDIAPLIKMITKSSVGELVFTGEQKLKVYYLDDVTLTFSVSDKPSFFGLMFEALGRNFTVLGSLDLIVSGEAEEGEENAFIVEDDRLLELIREYLLWRLKVLEAFEG